MTSTVATEIQQSPVTPKTYLETWGRNEVMRHVPALSWMVRKVDGDLRRRIDIVCASYDALTERSQVEPALTALCRALDRLAEVAKHGRTHQYPTSDQSAKVHEALHHAVTNLNSLDEALIGRRFPFQTLERSKAEPLVGALLVVIQVLERVVVVLRKLDPGLDERLLEGLVTLQEPLRKEPIA
jgi:hypothetical protein